MFVSHFTIIVCPVRKLCGKPTWYGHVSRSAGSIGAEGWASILFMVLLHPMYVQLGFLRPHQILS